MASKPKSTSRKRQQSNADESAKKRNKTAAASEGDDAEDSAIDVEEAFDVQREGKKGKKGKKTGGRAKKMYLFYFLIFIFYFDTLPLPVKKHGLTVKRKMTLRMQKALLLVSSRVYSNFYFYILF